MTNHLILKKLKNLKNCQRIEYTYIYIYVCNNFTNQNYKKSREVVHKKNPKIKTKGEEKISFSIHYIPQILFNHRERRKKKKSFTKKKQRD